jgi:hypothetical protein
LDSVTGGVNDVLAERIGLHDLRVLADPVKTKPYKLVVFVPSTHLQSILDALFALNVGRIGNYSRCSFRCQGVGRFTAGDGASPAMGTSGRFSEVQEQRVEVLVQPKDLDRVVDALKGAHPYEHMAYDLYPLAEDAQPAGLGRVGGLAQSVSLGEFADMLKTALNIGAVKVVGDLDATIQTVAVCSGSGSSLLAAAIGSGAQVYVSGDLGYHTARDAQQAGIGLVDVGHFGSERLIVEVLAATIRKAIQTLGLDVIVETADMESDPFHHR